MSDHMSEKIKWLSVAELSKQLHKSESTIKRIAKKLQISQPKAVRYEGKKMLINAECIPPIVSGHSEQLTDNDKFLTDHVTDSDKTTLERELIEVRERERLRLENTIKTLEHELAAKNELINRLTTTVENLTTASEFQNNLLNNLSLQIRTPKLPKRNWWQRIFKR